MRRLVVSILIPLLAVLTLVSPAYAGRTWCKTDPIIKVGDWLVDIQVGVDLFEGLEVNGDVRLRVTSPLPKEVIVEGVGFNGHGFDIELINRGNPNTIRISSSVPFSSNGQTQVALDVTTTNVNTARVISKSSTGNNNHAEVTLDLSQGSNSLN
jgi:hypothetical protein